MRAFKISDVPWKLSAQWEEQENQATNVLLTVKRERVWWPGNPPFMGMFGSEEKVGKENVFLEPSR
ncbi:hypothetical protein FRX31_027719 [Thalictrum thalictroides]|uniref:Uncharacterized protein n=1 Tax=Thalictrum thalictroides TaxID=46969 RepID=A0A7J6VEP9_THATH|nr:hypothetical protein FRX31_027719 [Thalictrum thalictroides]